MKSFLIIAGVVVVFLVISPVVWLSTRMEDQFEGKSVLRVSYPEKIKTLDPVLCGDTISAVMQTNVYEPLYTYHYLKRPVEVVPLVADALPEVSDDGLTYTMRIQPGVKYAVNPCFGVGSDGRPGTRDVTAHDFVLGFKRVADSHMLSPMAWSFLSDRVVGGNAFHERTKDYAEGDFSRYKLDIEGVKALDDLTLRVQLTEPFPAFIFVLAMHSFTACPPELIAYHLERTPLYTWDRKTNQCKRAANGGASIPMTERTAQINAPEQAVATGPYTITRWERGKGILFERNPLYSHETYPTEGEASDQANGLLADAGRPLPFIDVLDYQCITQDYAMWLQFLSGKLDVSGIPRDVFEQVINPDRGLSQKWRDKGIRLVVYEDPSVYWFGFNMQDPVLKASPSLRQAMCLAYDVDTYIDVLFNGRGKRAVNTLPSSFPVFEEAGPGPYYRYDLKAAREKLEIAKEELRKAGLLTPEGRIPPITIDLGGQDSTARRQGEFSQQQFEAAGIPVKIELNDWPTLQQKVHNKQVQAYAMGWHADYPDPENFLQLYYGPNIDKGTNSTNYSNPEFDRLYEKIIVMPDSPERREMCMRMVRMLSEDVPVLLLLEPRMFALPYDYVGNYKRHPIGYGMTKYYRIDEDRRRELAGGS